MTKFNFKKATAAVLTAATMVTAMAMTVSAAPAFIKTPLHAGEKASGYTGNRNAEGKPEKWLFTGFFNKQTGEPIMTVGYWDEGVATEYDVNKAPPAYNEKGELIKMTLIPEGDTAALNGASASVGDSGNENAPLRKSIVSSVNIATDVTLDAAKSKTWNFNTANFGDGPRNDDNAISVKVKNTTVSSEGFRILISDKTDNYTLVDYSHKSPVSFIVTGLEPTHKYSFTLLNLDTTPQTYSVSISSYRA